MSAQSEKKRRISSRRRVANPSKISEADGFLVTGSTSVEPPCMPEEKTESLNPENSQSETQKPPSPEVTMNRRKLGSSRRNKGGQHVKGSESYLKPKEKVEEQTSSHETEKTIEMPLAIQPQRREELSQGSESATHDSSLYLASTPDYNSEVQSSSTTTCPETDQKSLTPENVNFKIEIMHGGTNKSDTPQSEEIKEIAGPVGISELTSLSALSCPTVDQQLFDKSYSSVMSEEELTTETVYSVTAKDDERDKGEEMSKQDGNVQGSHVVSESLIKSEDIEFSGTQEVATDKSSPGEKKELECSVEQAAFSSSSEEVLRDEEQNKHFNLSEVKGAQHSEDHFNNMHEQEIKPAEMHDTKNPEVFFGKNLDQADVRNTNQCELTVERTDSCAEQEELYSVKQAEHPTKENNSEAFEDRSEDYYTRDAKKSQNSAERVETALIRVDETEGQVQDDRRPSGEQTVRLEREGLLSERDDSESSSQTLQSQMNAPLDSYPQQNDTDFNPIGNRRKLGSRRRHKGPKQVKETVAESYHILTDEDVKNTRDDEPIETAIMSFTLETEEQEKSMEIIQEGADTFDTAQAEELSSQVKENAHDISELTASSLLTSLTADQQLLDQSNYKEMPEKLDESKKGDNDTELFCQSGNLQDNSFVGESPVKSEEVDSSMKQEVLMEKHISREHIETEYSVEQTIVSSPKEKLLTSEEHEHFNLPEIKAAQYSEAVVDEAPEQETEPTEIHGIDHFSDSVTHDATENFEKISGNLMDKAELIVKSTDDCSANQGDLNPDNEKLEQPTKENKLETSEQTNEGNEVYATKIPQLSNTESIDPTQGQVYDTEAQVENYIKPSAKSAVDQEKEAFLPKEETDQYALQTLQSEIDASSDSQQQQYNTDLNPFGSRRKLGSSRRNKGRQHAKDSVADSYHRSTDEVVGNTSDIEPSETTKISLMIETAVQEKSIKTVLEGKDTFDTAQSEEVSDHIKESAHDGTLVGISELTTSSLHSSVTAGLIDQSFSMQMPEEELPNVFSVSEAETKEGDEETKHSPREPTELECSLEQGMVPSPKEKLPTNEDENGHFNLTKVKSCHFSEEAVNVVLDQELNPTEMHDIDPSSERVTHDATDELEIICGNVVDQAQIKDTNQPEEMVKSTGDCAEEQEDLNPDDEKHEYPTKENDFQNLEHTSENNNVCDTVKSHITDTERVDTALSQVYESEGQEPSAEQAVHQEKEGVCSEDEEGKSLQTLQSDMHVSLDFQTQHNDTNSNPFGSRRKLGSSRRSKGRQHAKDSVADSYQRSTDEVVGNTSDIEPSETTKISLTIETAVQEKSSKTVLEGKDTYDTAQSEEVSDHIKESAHDGTLVGISELTTSSLHSSVTAGLIDQSFSMQVPEEELPNLFSVSEAETKEGDEETKHSPREPTELECSLEQGMVPSPKEELPTNEDENGHFNLTKVKSCHFSEEAVNVVLDQELNPTEMHDIDPSSERVTHDATDELEIICGNVVDQAQIKDTNQPEEMVKSTGDCAEEQEDLNPDDEKHEYPTKENDFQNLEHTSENNNVCDTVKSHITDTERVDTALSQVYKIEGQEPSAEQAVHQEKEGVCSEDEEGKSLQTLQSDMHVSLDFQTQHNDTNSNPFGSRRKLGSSRRSKGRQHAKDSVADSYHRSTDEVVGNTSDIEPSETTKISLMIETAVQEKSIKTMLEGKDTYDTAQSEEVSDHIKESAHDGTLVGISELTTSSLHSSVTAGLIDQSFSMQVPEEELPNVFSVSEAETKEGDEETKHSPREPTELECSLEQGMVPSPKEELPTNEDENGHFNLTKVKSCHFSEEAVNVVLDQELNPTEMHDIDPSSERVTHDATDELEIICGNVVDQAQIKDTNQLEEMVKSTGDCAEEQEDLNPDDEKHEHPTKENDFENLEYTSENNSVCDTVKSHITDTERVDTALSQVYESEGQEPSAEQAVHQEKEGVCSEDEEGKSLQTLQSDTHVSLDFQTQHNDTNSNPFGSRRKLGSSRRNKGRQHAKDSVAESYHRSTDEVVGNTSDIEPSETTEVSMTVESSVQEKSMDTKPEEEDTFDVAKTEDVADQVEENAHVGISEVMTSSLPLSVTADQKLIDQSFSTEMSQVELPNVYSVTDRERKEGVEDTKHSVIEHTESECILDQAMFPSPKEEFLPNEENEHFNLPEVKGAHQSEDAVNTVLDQEKHRAEQLEINPFHESMKHDATDCSEVISGNLIDDAQINDINQSEVMVESAENSAVEQEDSHPDDEKHEHPTKENNFEDLEHTSENNYERDTKKSHISGTERVDTAPSQVNTSEDRVEDDIKSSAEQAVNEEKEGTLSEDEESKSAQTLQPETSTPLDSQLQKNYTDFKPVVSRRKLGSTRRNKGKQQIKEFVAQSCQSSTEELVANAEDNEPFEITKMLVTIETAVQEKSVETMQDTAQTEVNDQAKENPNLGISELPASRLQLSTVEQINVPFLRERESVDEEMGSEFLGQDGSLEEDIESSPQISKEKQSPTEHIQHEHSAEPAIASSPEGLPKDEEQNDHFNVSEDKGGQHSEHAVNKVHDEDADPTGMHEIDHSSKSVTHEALGDFEMICGNLIDKPEVYDTTEKESKGGDDDTGLLRQNGNVQANYLEGESHLKSENQSSKSVPLDGTGHFEVIPGNLTDQTEVGGNKPQSMVRSTGEFAANQESSNSDDLKDKHPKDDNFQAVEQTNEDDHVHKKITQISGIEVNTAWDQVCQVEGRVEDHMQLCATQQEREGLVSENEEGNSSLQKLHPEENLSVDSEPQQYKTDLNRLGNRRKLGSSRRNKKQQQVKESVAESCHELKVEVVESIRGSETVNTPQMLVAIERTSKEELSQGSEHEVIMPATQDCSLHSDIMPGYSSEGQSPNPETYQESSISLRDNQQEDDKSETVFKVEESNRSDGASLEGIDKSKESSLTSDEHEQFNLTEVRAAHYSEDAVDKTQEQEVKFTEMHKINLSSESATHDATKGSEIISVSLIGKAEASETNLFELTVKCEDDSDAKQGDLNPDDKQDEHPTKGNNFEALAHTNKDYSVCDAKRTQISGTERVDTATSLVCESEGQIKDDIKPSTEQTIHQEKEGIPSEDEENKSLHALQPEMHAPLDLEPQQSITKFSPIGSRRKLGSSRRNKGRQHVKDSVGESSHRSEEPVGNNRDNETIEPGLSLEIGTAVQEQSVETIQDIVQTEEVSDPVKAHVGISELPASSLHSGSNLQDNYLVSESHLKTEDIEASVTPEMSTGKDNPRKHTEPNDIVEQAELSSSKSALSVDEEQKEHVSLSKVSGILHSEDVVSEVHEDAVEPTQMQEMHHIDLSSVKETESLQILQSEINAPLVSQPQDSSVRIDEQAHTGFNPAGTRRKLGSSRRNKGRQQMKNSVAEQCHEQNDDVVKTTNVSFATETTRQAEIQKKTELDQRPHDIRMITSTGEENSDTFQKEDKILSQIVVDNSAIVSLDDASSSGNGVSVKSNEDTNEEGENLIKEPENSHQLAGYDSVKIDLIQSPEDDSDIRIRYDDSVTTRPITLDALEQEDASHDQKGEVSSCDKDSLGQEMNMQQTNDTVETAGDLTVKHSDTEAERQVDVKVFGQDDGGEKIYESTKADHEAQEMNPSQEIRYAAHSSAPFGLKENFRAELTMDVPEESGMSTLVNTSDRQQGIQEKTRSDNSENLQGQSKQRRRKMGSTRRTQVKRGPEAAMDDKDETKERDFNKEADMRDLDEMEVLEEITRGVTADVSQHTNANPPLSLINEEQQETNDDKGQELQSSTSDLQSNVISHTDSLTVALTEELAVADVEIVNSEIGGGAGEEHKDGQVSKTNDVNEGANNKNLEMKSASPHRRRKMGSTRKNLGSRSRREVLNQEQEVESEATDTAVSVEDVKTQSFPRLKEKEELQLHTEDKEGDSELRKEKVFETVTHRETVESHFKPPPQTFEENPVSHGQVGETEHQLTPSYSPAIPSTSPKHDAMSETSGRRVRKFGSHRKSRGHQNNENLTAEEDTITHTQRRGDARSITGEGVIKTTEEESPHLDKIPEVDENEKKPSSHASSSGTEEHSRSVSERTHVQVTPVQHPRAEMRLSPENQRTLSLAGGPGGAALTSKGYNVLMVGDSSVGKTSFMKRAQCGKFFLDLPASIGLDFCMWTVVVDGKPVVLKLWDTAGQERFRSVTRQSFHRAQAFLLMYDITSPESFSAVSYWAHCIQEEAVENVTILLLGNKSDRANRQIRTQDGEILAKEYNFEFMECSAATGENVIQSLETVARILSQKADTREETTVLHKEPQQQKSSGCC